MVACGMLACQVLLFCSTRFEWRAMVLSNGWAERDMSAAEAGTYRGSATAAAKTAAKAAAEAAAKAVQRRCGLVRVRIDVVLGIGASNCCGGDDLWE
jgi:hypothetical protein